MTHLNEQFLQKPILRSQFLHLVLISFVLIAIHATPASAQQWETNGANINNTNAGKVGIGTTVPDTRLTVVGSGTTIPAIYNLGDVLTLITPNDNFNAFTIAKGGVTNPQGITIGINHSMKYSEIQAAHMGVTANALILNRQGGNVGIGTSTPTSLLHISGPKANFPGVLVTEQTGGKELSFGWDNDGTVSQIMSGGASGFRIFTNNAERMRILSSGNIGIGTNAPAEALHLYNSGGVGQIELQGGGTHAGFLAEWNGGGLFLSTNRNLRTGNNHNSSKPGAQIALGPSGTGDTVFYTTSSGAIGNGTELVRIKDSGNVGIGITNPSEKLDVIGNLKVTGNINVSGNINAKFQDLAEWVPATEHIPAGTVVVLDTTKCKVAIALTIPVTA